MGPKRNVKVNKCKHIFQQGQKAGKRCNKNCRGEYCKDHNKHRHNYEKKRYDEKVIEKKSDENALLRRILEATCKADLPDGLTIDMCHRHNSDKAKSLIDRCNALKIMRGDMTLKEYSDKCTDFKRLRCVERYINSYNKRKTIGKHKKQKTIQIDLSKEDIQDKLDRLLRKRDKLVIELRSSREICKAYAEKVKQLELGEDIEDQLDQINEVIENKDEFSEDINDKSNQANTVITYVI